MTEWWNRITGEKRDNHLIAFAMKYVYKLCNLGTKGDSVIHDIWINYVGYAPYFHGYMYIYVENEFLEVIQIGFFLWKCFEQN